MMKKLSLITALLLSANVYASPLPIPPDIWAATQTPPYTPRPAPRQPDPQRPELNYCYVSEAAFVSCQYYLAVSKAECEAAVQQALKNGQPVLYVCYQLNPL